MREIVTLSIGQAGNQINKEFWKTISKEHGVDTQDGVYKGDNDVQYQKLNVFFEEVPGGRCVPRSILVDLEPGVLNAVQSNKELGSLFNPDNFINAQNGAGNNWAKGMYNEGAEIVEDVLDRVRKQVELCDAFNSFQITHSIGGGTGSGFGSLILEKLSEEYCTNLNINYSIFPGSTHGGNSDVVVEPYNSILTINALIESSQAVFGIENSALNKICQNNLKIANPSFDDINFLIAQGMSNSTATLRFPGYQNNCDYRKLTTNLVPFPRLHFISQGQAPLLTAKNQIFEKLNIKDVTGMLFDSRCMYNNCDPFRQGKILTASCLLRGLDLSSFEAEKTLKEKLTQNKDSFVEWIPDNIMNSFCQVPAANMSSNFSGSMLTNTSAAANGFKTLTQSFEAMFRKNAYVHWYTAEGMDTSELREALSNVQDLIAEYQQYENATADDGDDAEMEDMEEAVMEDQIVSKFKSSFQQYAHTSMQSNSTKATNSMNGSI